jgi:hypothetical protein
MKFTELGMFVVLIVSHFAQLHTDYLLMKILERMGYLDESFHSGSDFRVLGEDPWIDYS